MSPRRVLNRMKAHPIVVTLAAVGAVLAFVITFGKNVSTLCSWLNLCNEQESASPIERLEFGQHRTYVEQPWLLAMPQFREARSANPEFDAGNELVLDEFEIGTEMFESVNSGEFDNATDFYAARYEFATYSHEYVDYMIRYDKKSQEVSAILLEHRGDGIKCQLSDVGKLESLRDVLSQDRPRCLGQATIADFFPGSGASLKHPMGYSDRPATCWGGLSLGGASGHGSFVEVACYWARQSMVEPDLSYLVKVGIQGNEIANTNYYFDERPESAEGSFDEFIRLAGKYTVEYVVVFP